MPDFQPIKSDADFERFVADFTSYERLRTFAYSRDSMKLDRMRRFAAELGDPQRRYPSVHIAGTKGKGTTCLILESLLLESHDSIGCYTSPHVEHIRERVRVNRDAITERQLCDDLNGMLAVLERLEPLGESAFPTFFELMTGIAMRRFGEAPVDWAIYEVGLGGRLDATNILSPEWTAITSVGLEHTHLLGDTVEKIAAEKAGILKPGVPLVLGPIRDATAHDVIAGMARERDCPVFETSHDDVVRRGDGRLAIRGLDRDIAPGAIRGPGIRDDLAVAVTIWRGILERHGDSARASAVERALERLVLPARVELVGGNPGADESVPVVLDGAHTPESVESLIAALREIDFPLPCRFLLSFAADKSVPRILAHLRDLASDIVVTRADPLRSLSPDEIAAHVESELGLSVPGENRIDDPITAFEHSRRDGSPVVVTGSLYLAGAIRRVAFSGSPFVES